MKQKDHAEKFYPKFVRCLLEVAFAKEELPPRIRILAASCLDDAGELLGCGGLK